MKSQIRQLEEVLTQNLLLTTNLKNELTQRELEKHDLVKEISLGIIDIIDSYERAEEIIKENELNKSEETLKVIKRYKFIQKKLLALLKKNGVTKVEFPDNKLIVGLCEVVDIMTDKSRQNDEIITVVRNGYIRANELLRAAQVIIVKN